ncbi:MAG TPA: class I SAM-dependent methyltransferase [Planctomycetota bacterium]|nr:class I SAM-dependent methyltransferase [Planctomycetota bacterium]
MVGDIPPDIAPSKPPKLEQVAACPLCDSSNVMLAPQQPDPPFGLMQCAACGGIFLSPRPRIDAMPAYYDDYYGGEQPEEPSARQIRRSRRHFKRLARHARPGRLLEVGAGDGYFLHAAKEAGWTVEGLELSTPRVERAKKWFGLNLSPQDLFSANLQPRTYDAMAMFQLIEHVHDPRGIIRKSHELLKPGGLLMMSTPNVLAYARKNRDVNSWRIPRHLFFFSPRTLVRTVEKAGFTVLRRGLKFHAAVEERLGWHPWQTSSLLGGAARDLWTPFGLHVIARKK